MNKLATQEARFRALIQATSNVVWTANENGEFTEPQISWENYTGQSFSSHKDFGWIEMIHPLDKESVLHAWKTAVREKKYFELKGRIWSAVNNEYRHFEARAVSVTNDHGKNTEWIGMIIDVHDQYLAEEKFRLAQEQERKYAEELQRSNQDLDQFAHIASHDLRAPLRAIDNLSKWVVEDAGDKLTEASKRHLTQMQQRISRMERLLEDLLAYSRAGKSHSAIKEINTETLVQEITDFLAPPEGFVIKTGEKMPLIKTEKVPLEQILRNLISNAIKHHDKGKGTIEVNAKAKGNTIEFSIKDDGPGIAPEYHERVFEMFRTLRPRDEVEGSGVGLAIVKKLVESQGGKVVLESNLGEGCMIHFTWPIFN